MKDYKKHQKWFENLIRESFSLDEYSDISEREKALIEGEIKIRNLQMKREKQRLKMFQKSVLEDAAKEIRKDVKVVPNKDNLEEEEVKEAAEELNNWLKTNPKIHEELNSKVDEKIEKFLEDIMMDKF